MAPARGWRLPPTPFLGRGARLSVTDLIATAGGVLLLLAGWAVQQAHDGRVERVTIGAVAVAYPTGWLPLPTAAPALAQWTDETGFGATLTLYASPAAGETAGEALEGGIGNPALTRPAYTPLRSEPTTLGGRPAVRSDYAYAQTTIAQSSPPVVVMGWQLAWVADDQLYVLALEAPERDWPRVEPLFSRLAAAVGEGSAP